MRVQRWPCTACTDSTRAVQGRKARRTQQVPPLQQRVKERLGDERQKGQAAQDLCRGMVEEGLVDSAGSAVRPRTAREPPPVGHLADRGRPPHGPLNLQLPAAPLHGLLLVWGGRRGRRRMQGYERSGRQLVLSPAPWPSLLALTSIACRSASFTMPEANSSSMKAACWRRMAMAALQGAREERAGKE